MLSVRLILSDEDTLFKKKEKKQLPCSRDPPCSLAKSYSHTSSEGISVHLAEYRHAAI